MTVFSPDQQDHEIPMVSATVTLFISAHFWATPMCMIMLLNNVFSCFVYRSQVQLNNCHFTWIFNLWECLEVYILKQVLLNIGKCLENIGFLYSVQFSHSVMSDSLQPHESQHARPPCPSPTPRVHPNSMHRVGDAIQPSHPLVSPSPPAPNPSQHQSLFQWVNSSHEVAKVLEFQL